VGARLAAVAGRDAGVPSPTRRAVLLAGLPPSQPKPPAPPRGDVPFAGPVVAAAAGHLGDQILVDERHFFSPLIVHRAVAACPYPLPLGVAVGAPARCFIERRRLRQRSTSRSTQSRSLRGGRTFIPASLSSWSTNTVRLAVCPVQLFTFSVPSLT